MLGVSDIISQNNAQASSCLVNLIKSIVNNNNNPEEKISDITQLIFEFGDSSTHLKSNTCLNAFKEITTLSSGGFGVVFRGKHRLDGQSYAIKVIPLTLSPEKDDLTTILLSKIREVRFLAQLDHPNIIRYHNSWMDFCETGDPVEFIHSLMEDYRGSNSFTLSDGFNNSYSDEDDIRHNTHGTSSNIQRSSSDLVLSKINFNTTKLDKIHLLLHLQMELMDETLSQWKQLHNPPLTTLYLVFNEILQGVEFLHQTEPPIIHCDLKPDNILISHSKCSSRNCSPLHNNHKFQNKSEPEFNLTVKIADFGLLSVLGSNWGPLSHEGTASYKAPELKEGERPTPSSDIYSLGIIFYEMMHQYNTTMEKILSVNDFKTGKFSTNTILDRMVLSDPNKRPTVTEVRSYLNLLYTQDNITT